jgi:hypothetical protein
MICPCCKREIENEPVNVIEIASLTGMERSIAEVVLSAPGISGSQIAERIYHKRMDGGPLHAVSSISRYVSRANNKLVLHGWKMSGRDGMNGYRFIQVPIPVSEKGEDKDVR